MSEKSSNFATQNHQTQKNMLRVKDVDYLGDYRLAHAFSNGEHKVVDLEPYLVGEVFGTLHNKA